MLKGMAVALVADKQVGTARSMLQKAMAIPHLAIEKDLQKTVAVNAELVRA